MGKGGTGVESNCATEFQEIKKQFQDVYESLTVLASSLGQERIDVLNELKLLSRKFSDAGKLASFYHVSRLLVPYTNNCGEIFKAVRHLSSKRKGALIVVQREDRIDEFITKGVPMNADISSSLLDSLFHVGSPLHDGAVLIRNDVIVSAANILPLTRKTYNQKKLGTRHRAAIGLSELTDALVFVVSEETGKESFAYNGSLYRFQNIGGE